MGYIKSFLLWARHFALKLTICRVRQPANVSTCPKILEQQVRGSSPRAGSILQRKGFRDFNSSNRLCKITIFSLVHLLT